MPIMFGHIKKVFVSKWSSDVWLVASSGVYLLRSVNAAQEYKEIHKKFLRRARV